MDVPKEVYNWIADFQIVQKLPEDNEEENPTIDAIWTKGFLMGPNFYLILKSLAQTKSQKEGYNVPITELDTFRTDDSPSSKLFNWNVITKILALFDINIDSDTKALIVAGDASSLAEILAELHATHLKLSSMEAKAPAATNKTKVAPDGSIYIDTLMPGKPLEETETVLEFLLVSFCQNFGLKPKQAAGLLTQSNKYLAHLIAKGLKGNFDKIIEWYQKLYQHVKHLLKLVLNEEASGSVNLILSALRPGFFARNLSVAQWCCRLFSKLGMEFGGAKVLPLAWDWFVKEFGGLDACILSLRKFGAEIRNIVISVLVQFAKNNFLELFSLHLRNAFPETSSYLVTIHEILIYLTEIRTAKEEIVKEGIVDFWIELSIREAESDSMRYTGSRQAALGLLTEIWIRFPDTVEKDEEMSANILMLLKRGMRSRSTLLNHASIVFLFRLLDTFSEDRNLYAPIIYKTLTFAVVENHHNSDLREFFLLNFLNTFKSITTIPVGVLLDPLIKQIQVSENDSYTFTLTDYQFFAQISKHPRITIKNAVQILDVLGKILLKDTIAARTVYEPFVHLCERFINSEPLQEYIFRFAEYAISTMSENEAEFNPTRHNKKLTRGNVEKIAENTQFRNNALNIVSEVILFQARNLNSRLKDLFWESLQEYRKRYRRDFRGYVVVLKLLRFQVPPMKTKRVAAQSQEPPALRPPQDEKAQSKIQEIQQKRIELEQKRVEDEVKRSVEEARKKRSLKQQLEKRKLEIGHVGTQNDKTQIFEDKGNIRRKHQLDIQLVDLENETPFEIETMNIVLKRYAHVLKQLFKKYSATGYSTGGPSSTTFESAASRKDVLLESEFYSMLKDHGVSQQMLRKEDFHKLMALYNLKAKVANNSVDYQRFLGLFTQTAIFIYSRRTRDLSNYPIGVSLLALFHHFRDFLFENNKDTILYDEPDPGVGDRDIIRRLNYMLAKDPQATLPQGYKKVIEKEIDVHYRVPKSMPLHPAFKAVLEILDDIFDKGLGMHLLEPQTVIKSTYRARGVLIKPDLPPDQTTRAHVPMESPRDQRIRKQNFRKNVGVHQASALKDPILKYEVTNTHPNKRQITLEWALVLDGVLQRVENGAIYVQRINRAQQSKIDKVRERERSRRAESRKRRLRKQVIEERMSEQVAKKEWNAQFEKQIEQEVKRKDEERQRRKEAKRRSDKEKLSLWNFNKRQERESRASQVSSTQGPSSVTSVERKNFWSTKRLELKKIAELTKAKKAKLEADSAAKEKEKLDSVRKYKKQHTFKLEQSRRERETKGFIEANILNQFQSPPIQSVLNEHERMINTLFSHYVKQQPLKLGEDTTGMQFKAFNAITSGFNIWPGLVSSDEAISIFRHFTVNKPTSNVVMDIHEFKEGLFRLSLLGQEKINNFMGSGSGYDAEVFEGLFKWMDIPDTPNGTLEKIKSLK